MIFGRRGSGKSSLIAKANANLSIDRKPTAIVDLEPFKGHSYPDLLISVLISTLRAFRVWIDKYATAPATKTSIWQKLLGRKPTRPPFNNSHVKDLLSQFDIQIESLEKELHAADEAVIEKTQTTEGSTRTSASVHGELSTPGVGAVGSELSGEFVDNASDKSSETFRRSKMEYLKRRIIDFQRLFDRLSEIADCDCFLLLDDLYHIRKIDQPRVVDYLHSVAKGHRMWVKVGTIRHRSRWYVHSTPPLGVKLGDDADEINLDLTLEKYSITKNFLTTIISNLSSECGLEVSEYLTDGAVDRLVLACGGVARDFLGILRRAIDVARERGDLDRRPKITAEDINVASGEYDITKQDEFRTDTYSDEEQSLNNVFNNIRDFCLNEVNSNCFLIEQDYRGPVRVAINELVDLKLLHRIRSRVTVNTRTQRGKAFEAFMLDLSQYAGSRRRRGLNIIEFWRPGTDNDLRRASLILDPHTHESFASFEDREI